jgi:hypothetical protein
MTTGRREQAIAASAALLIAELEHEAKQPTRDTYARGRVADGGIDQEK